MQTDPREYEVVDPATGDVKKFDGYNPDTGNLIEAKNFTENFSTKYPPISKTADDLAAEDRIAGNLVRKVEVPVSTKYGADIVQSIVKERSLENIIVQYPKE